MKPHTNALPESQAALDQPTSTQNQQWTIHDANLALFSCLSQPMGKRRALPPEIILLILAQRSRWILRSIEQYPLTSPVHNRGHRISQRQGEDEEAILLTRAFSDQDILTLERVIFTFSSRDQGWSSYPKYHGTYDQSYTWIEAGAWRRHDHATVADGRWELHRNRHAGGEPEDYRIEFGRDHELFATLWGGAGGDRIAMWARAMYPGWQNYVHEANIELCFHGPDDLHSS